MTEKLITDAEVILDGIFEIEEILVMLKSRMNGVLDEMRAELAGCKDAECEPEEISEILVEEDAPEEPTADSDPEPEPELVEEPVEKTLENEPESACIAKILDLSAPKHNEMSKGIVKSAPFVVDEADGIGAAVEPMQEVVVDLPSSQPQEEPKEEPKPKANEQMTMFDAFGNVVFKPAGK